MSVEVVTVWAPRPNHEKWRDGGGYLSLLNLQRKTAKHFGHFHTLVTDDASFEGALVTKLPENLMKAMLAGVIARLERPAEHDLALFDMDVLVNRPLDPIFASRRFDLGLTNRHDPVAPINNGAMFVPARSRERALAFFQAALDECEEHWGGDQEAISRMAAPVPEPNIDQVLERRGLRLWFMRGKVYAAVPKVQNAPHKSFTVHFKGDTKDWAAQYARTRIL